MYDQSIYFNQNYLKGSEVEVRKSSREKKIISKIKNGNIKNGRRMKKSKRNMFQEKTNHTLIIITIIRIQVVFITNLN